MIFTLIVILFLIIGFIGLYLYNKSTFFDKYYEAIEGITFLGLICGFIGLIVITVFLISGHTMIDLNIQKAQVEYDSLVKRLEIVNSDYEDVSKSEVIKDIAEWNNKVLTTKHWTESKWTNWFHSKRYADSLNYIELED